MRACLSVLLLLANHLCSADVATDEEVARIQAAIVQLGGESFAEREAANILLQKFGTLAAPLLLKATTTDPEVRNRVSTLLRILPPSRTEREMPDYWNKDMNQEIPRLYEEWESEQKRLHGIDGTPCAYIGGFRSNVAMIKREFANFFRMKPDAVLDAVIQLRKAHPEEELKFKDESTLRLSPARFLASFRPSQEPSLEELESSARLFEAARSTTPPSEADWKALRPHFHTGVSGPKIAMVFNNASLVDALWTILVQSDVRIFSEPPALFGELATKRVSIRIENVSLESALNSALESSPELEYKLEGRGVNRYLLLRKKPAK